MSHLVVGRLHIRFGEVLNPPIRLKVSILSSSSWFIVYKLQIIKFTFAVVKKTKRCTFFVITVWYDVSALLASTKCLIVCYLDTLSSDMLILKNVCQILDMAPRHIPFSQRRYDLGDVRQTLANVVVVLQQQAKASSSKLTPIEKHQIVK